MATTTRTLIDPATNRAETFPGKGTDCDHEYVDIWTVAPNVYVCAHCGEEFSL